MLEATEAMTISDLSILLRERWLKHDAIMQRVADLDIRLFLLKILGYLGAYIDRCKALLQKSNRDGASENCGQMLISENPVNRRCLTVLKKYRHLA